MILHTVIAIHSVHRNIQVQYTHAHPVLGMCACITQNGMETTCHRKASLDEESAPFYDVSSNTHIRTYVRTYHSYIHILYMCKNNVHIQTYFTYTRAQL